MQDRILTIVDVETTGASAKMGRIIEIGVLRVEHGEVVRTYKSLINPGQPIPEFITGMTGIRERDVLAAPAFEEIADELLELFEGATFVAHNAPFDYSFLRAEFARLGYGFLLPRLCTVQLSRALYPEHKRHNLSALIDRFSFTCQSRHRAYDDAEVLWQFLQMLERTVPTEELNKHVKRLTNAIHRIAPSTKKETFIYERDMEYAQNE
jgi:DNA polymerase-3 subunit epsilon